MESETVYFNECFEKTEDWQDKAEIVIEMIKNNSDFFNFEINKPFVEKLKRPLFQNGKILLDIGTEVVWVKATAKRKLNEIN